MKTIAQEKPHKDLPTREWSWGRRLFGSLEQIQNGILLKKWTAQHASVQLPAPSMAEMWRELPHGSWIHTGCQGNEAWFDEKCFRNTNPTDALIDLKLWSVRKERKEE